MSNLEEVKKLIRSLLVSAPTKVTIQSLARDFQDLEGYNIPYKELGFNSLIHLLHSIPDVLRVNGTSNFAEVTLIVSEKTAHVSDLVMKQKKPANRKNAPKKSIIKRNTYPNNARFNNVQSRPYILNTPSVSQTPRTYPQVYPIVNPALSPFPRPILQVTKKSPQLTKHVPKETPIVNEIRNVESKLEKLKLRNSKPRIFSRAPPTNLNLTISLRDDVTVSKDDSDTKVPVKVQENLKKLILKHPDGVWCTDLNTEYELSYGHRIQYEKFGFLSLTSLCLTLDDIFFCRKESSCDYKLYDKHKTIPKIITINKDEPPIETINLDPFAIIPVKTPDWDNYSDIIPENVLKLGEIVKKNVVDLDIGTEIPIIISEISSPSNFWVYKDDGVLDFMMDSMQHFYRDNKTKYLIPEFLLEVGLYCVVHLLNEFQRGIIVDFIPNMGHAKVYFLDYGTLTNIPKSKIWYLKQEFATLDCQAIKAELANLKAKNEKWSRESSKRFKDLISGKRISARITKNDENMISVYVSECTEPKRPLMCINEVLVKEGFAEYIDNEVPSVDQETLDRRRGMLKLLERVKMRRQICDANNL